QEISTLANRANEPGNQLREEILFEGLNALNMLNTKYIIVNPDTPPLTNPDALGNCWFVSSVIAADNPDRELEMVSQIDPATEAVTDVMFEEEINKAGQITDSMAVIELKSYSPNELIYSSSSKAAQTAVFSEIYYPAGWNAYIDGEPHNHFRVNYVLRAMNILPGEHEIIFRFEPESYRTGNIISFAGSVILLLIITATIVYYVRRKKITEG
ncbi:MAG: YfhO family protein, partial [Bacteroidales bacterium]